MYVSLFFYSSPVDLDICPCPYCLACLPLRRCNDVGALTLEKRPIAYLSTGLRFYACRS